MISDGKKDGRAFKERAFIGSREGLREGGEALFSKHFEKARECLI
jgi:hypothetical protein